MTYRCVATSVAGFVQQLAVSYVANGYYFYVTGAIPDHKDPARIDGKMVEQYGIDQSKWTRCRRKRVGLANVHYLRYGRFFVLIATRGEHSFYAGEAGQIRDIRRHPIHFGGYSIGCRQAKGQGKYHSSVRIDRAVFGEIKANFEKIAVHQTVEELYMKLREIPYEPYAPVRDQLRIILRAINRRRRLAGLELVPWNVLRLRRSPVRVFDDENSNKLEPAENSQSLRIEET
ncbi:MAG TPA: hypothetical protein P5186_13765 [Candidatus Paceibacterota bacterium]|nr:hypothetical protein [Candidatus Paceibacterota bacterium]